MLKVQNVSARTTSEALVNLDFEVKSGQITAVLGRSDSGKSLLGQVLAQKKPVSDGEIIVGSYRQRIHSQKLRVQIGYLPNPAEAEQFLTGFEWLDLVGSLYHLSPDARTKRITELAGTLDLQDELYVLIERVSQSTRQKLALAGALIHSPKLLIVDEPFQYLDFADQLRCANLLRAQADSGCTVVLITDNLSLAEKISDEYFVLDRGQKILSGTLQQLVNQTKVRASRLESVLLAVFGNG